MSVIHGPPQEGGRRFAALIGERLDVREAAVVVDADVHELSALVLAVAGAIARDAMPSPADTSEVLDVQVQQFPGNLRS